MLTINLRCFQNEDVIYRLLPYTFDNKVTTWYFTLQAISIQNWDTFEDMFIKKFGDNK